MLQISQLWEEGRWRKGREKVVVFEFGSKKAGMACSVSCIAGGGESKAGSVRTSMLWVLEKGIESKTEKLCFLKSELKT